MTATLLTDIPFQIDPEQLLKRLHMDENKPFAEEILDLAKQAEQIAKPKAVYRMARIEQKEDQSIIVEGVTLSSRILRVNVADAHRVFLFVATCGRELAEWGQCFEDPLFGYAAEVMEEMALMPAMHALQADIDARYQPGKLAMMNPGSLPDWPLPEQRNLFSLIGNVEEMIGVSLLEESYLMVPAKSVSGLRFPTATNYENCQLCDMPKCPGRRAEFEAGLYAEKYGKNSSRQIII